MALMREETRSQIQNRRLGALLGGSVCLAVGLGMAIAFRIIDEQVWAMGLIPGIIGLAIVLFALFALPKQGAESD